MQTSETTVQEFTRQLAETSGRLVDLRRRMGDAPGAHDAWLPEAFEGIAAAIEELQIAQEELYQQNEELASSRLSVEAERQRYQELFDFAPDGYLVTDLAGVILEANREAAVMLNLGRRDLAGKPLAVFIPLPERNEFRNRLNGLRDRARDWDLRLRPNRGTPFDATATVAMVRDTQGRPSSLRWLLRDNTERKRAGERVAKLSERLRILTEDLHTQVNGRSAELEQALAAERTARRQAEQTVVLAERLRAAVRALARDLPLDIVRATVMAHAVTMQEADAGLMVQVDPDSETLQVLQTSGLAPELTQALQHIRLADRLPCAEAIRENRIVTVESPRELAVHYPELGALRLPFQAYIAIPLEYGFRAEGAVQLAFTAPRAFGPGELACVQVFGVQCAQALARNGR